jgi:hypothetical protein
VALLMSRPWQSQDETGFHRSALMAALLLGALLITIA